MKDHDENDVTRRKCLCNRSEKEKREEKRREREKRETRLLFKSNISQKIKQNE